MASIDNIFRFILRYKYWLMICPIVVALLVYLMVRGQRGNYESSAVLYTGVTSGFNIETEGTASMDHFSASNAMDNLLSIANSTITMEKLSLKLFAQSMMYGNMSEDNVYITAASYRNLLKIVPVDVAKLIDKQSMDVTLKRLRAYAEDGKQSNFVYGLLHWYHPHYSIFALQKRLKVVRVFSSDMVEVKYECDDPALTYQTVLLFIEAFKDQYQTLRFRETNDVVAYFEAELAKTRHALSNSEDALMVFNTNNRIINYEEQTKFIASQNEKYEIQLEQILLAYDGSRVAIAELEDRLDNRANILMENSTFVRKLKSISDLSATIARNETFTPDSIAGGNKLLGKYKKDLAQQEVDLQSSISKIGAFQNTKEGIASDEILQQWLVEKVRHEKAKAELEVMKDRKKELDNLYSTFSPIGADLKRKERDISITEQSYLSLLHSLSLAKLKQKNLQISSASLQTTTPPVYPLDSKPSKKKLLVLIAAIAALIFAIVWFLLLELFDRTLRDARRTKRITGFEPIGVFPLINTELPYSKEIEAAASEYAANAVLSAIAEHRTGNIVNILSTIPEAGKGYISQHIIPYLEHRGFVCSHLVSGVDFDQEDKKYIVALSAQELPLYKESQHKVDAQVDIYIIEHHTTAGNHLTPYKLLGLGCLNLLVLDATRAFNKVDAMFLRKLQDISDSKKNLSVYLNGCTQAVFEEYVGLLPPYTFARMLGYRLLNMELTSSESIVDMFKEFIEQKRAAKQQRQEADNNEL